MPFLHYSDNMASFPGEQPLFYTHLIIFYFPTRWEFPLLLGAQFFIEKDKNYLKTTILGVFGRDGCTVIKVREARDEETDLNRLCAKTVVRMTRWHKPCGSFRKCRLGISPTVVRVVSKRAPAAVLECNWRVVTCTPVTHHERNCWES